MTLPRIMNNQTLSSEELIELDLLKQAITDAPQYVSSSDMEKFAELMVRKLAQS